MAETYFSKIPEILYNNVQTRDISERVKLTPATRRLSTAYYPFELKNGLRPDVVANSYYSDPTMDWMIYLINGVTDPYYDWYLYPQEFEAYIVKKYGSLEAAMENISHYQTNWATDPINMTIAGWTAAGPDVQKYYTPIFGARGTIMSYTRRQEDWVTSTNKIIRLTVNNSTKFTIGEKVDISNSYGDGNVTYTDSTSIMIQHVSGIVSGYNNWDPSPVTDGHQTVTGEDSGAVGTISARTVVNTVLPATEYVYWEPVSYYDKETNLNESKRYIYLMDSNLVLKVSEEIRKSLLK